MAMEPNYSIVFGEEQKIPSRVDLSGIFFDPASQHFVLHSEGQFFTWSFSNQEVELLFDLGNDYRRNSSGAENVLFRQSLAFEIEEKVEILPIWTHHEHRRTCPAIFLNFTGSKSTHI